MNLGTAIGDEPASVAANRAASPRRAARCRSSCARCTASASFGSVPAIAPRRAAHDADASVTTEPGVACIVQAADCLPVLFAAPDARAVAAAHAGWRGLAAGVIEATLAAVCERAGCAPRDVSAWLGACIGPARFEVGADVLAAFGVDPALRGAAAGRFVARGDAKWLADLPGLACDRLAAAGVERIDAGCGAPSATRHGSSPSGATASPGGWPPRSGSPALAEACRRRRAARRDGVPMR